jgi:SAM-dependent methyltransferase
LPELKLLSAKYDVVVMSELIEHLPNPLPYVEDVLRILRPGGVLYLTTPNYGSLQRRLGGPEQVVFPPDHLWGHSRRSVCRLLAQTGFTRANVWSSGLNPWFILHTLRSVNRPITLSPAEDTATYNALITRSNALRSAAQTNPWVSLLRTTANVCMRLAGTGDTLKALAVKAR